MDTTETPAQSNPETSALTTEQIRAMKNITERIYAYREPDGYDPSKLFHRKVNKRSMPDYYDVIKEPVALSTLKAKLLTKDYKNFSEFVRDCALISHNAQTYNRPESGAYQDAVVLRREFEKEFKALADHGVISHEVATYPDLGELPPVESPLPAEDEEEDDVDDEEDDEEDEEESDEDGPKRKRKRGPRSTAAISKREGGKDDGGLKGNDAESRKRRGRPPRVDTPMESRIKAVLKAIRKYKNEHGNIIIHQFEKLPDKVAMPEYYMEIKEPIAIEQIKRKQKRKKYQSVDHFMRDIDVMFNNAKSYNQDESQIYKDAVYLQTETHKLADAEKQKPDTDFQMEEGRLPLPGGILHNGQLWKVGDWIHIQNPNDVTKPIVAQIYRTWQDTDGEKWVNACWYYRPEQTVHQYEKHFYPNEVVKTGQYRDHRVDEIIDRCFVMFITRYSKGRPRGLSADKDVYVCDSRYNEEKHKLNKIKTWASCLPDEVRDQDYPMDMFDGGVKRIKKVPSPILHLLKEDAKETDDLPKPRWGADNAPPVVGAVYKGPRDENQSPPPEATPSPPPQPPPSVAKPVNNPSAYDTPSYPRDSQGDAVMGGYNQPPATSFNPPQGNSAQAYGSSLPQYHQHSASPAPVHHPHQYSQQAPNSYTQPHPAAATSSHLEHHATPNRYVNQRVAGPNIPAQRLPEVGHLPETANLAIPEDTRNQFQQDENGHVLWFTSPPVDTLPPTKPHSAIGHTAKYLAEKIRIKKALKEKRKAEGLREEKEEQPQLLVKKAKQGVDWDLQQQINDLAVKALWKWNEQMQVGTEKIYQSLYGQHWEEGKKYEMEKLAKVQADERKRQAEFAKTNERKSNWDAAKASCSGTGIYKDDWDPRF
ncbi:MAG: hypothetical protein ASARMPREDX12_004659 [Alectoria sarmentosa]|nr:MAG: hypothetical protein ASARMPREDX12_004659 [Alectoria sarmentosa]